MYSLKALKYSWQAIDVFFASELSEYILESFWL